MRNLGKKLDASVAMIIRLAIGKTIYSTAQGGHDPQRDQPKFTFRNHSRPLDTLVRHK